MDKSQIKEVENCLITVIKRVANNEKASPAEIAALPEIVRVLCEMTSMEAM